MCTIKIIFVFFSFQNQNGQSLFAWTSLFMSTSGTVLHIQWVCVWICQRRTLDSKQRILEGLESQYAETLLALISDQDFNCALRSLSFIIESLIFIYIIFRESRFQMLKFVFTILRSVQKVQNDSYRFYTARHYLWFNMKSQWWRNVSSFQRLY